MLYVFSSQNVFIGENSKLKDLKEYSVPIEVVPVGVSYVISALKDEAKIREGNGKISDNGNIILDVKERKFLRF